MPNLCHTCRAPAHLTRPRVSHGPDPWLTLAIIFVTFAVLAGMVR